MSYSFLKSQVWICTSEGSKSIAEDHCLRMLFSISLSFLLALSTLVYAIYCTCKSLFSLSTYAYYLRKGNSSWGADSILPLVSALLSSLNWGRFISQFCFSQLARISAQINWSPTKTIPRSSKISFCLLIPYVQLPAAYSCWIGSDS